MPPTGDSDHPIPRDPPDQQAGDGSDPLDVPRPPASEGSSDKSSGATSGKSSGESSGESSGKDPEKSSGEPSGENAPDPDEAGAGGDGEPRSGSVHPERPVPDEPSG
ncbi:hypothetical protein [Streptomyces sp. CAU 1734]|uniref:hypothetical protein n=1 Tax=Streptomyces sp. CAU 1734 TaxID=3140360 RepID=UPI0032604436